MRWDIADVRVVMLQRDSNEFPTMDIVYLLGGATASSRTPPELPARPAAQPRRTTRCRRAVLLLVAAGLVVGLWWGSGYVVAYTDDAYVDSDVVQVAPEVAGPIEAMHVRDNQWIRRGSIRSATATNSRPAGTRTATDRARSSRIPRRAHGVGKRAASCLRLPSGGGPESADVVARVAEAQSRRHRTTNEDQAG
jgi:hypothetical protein